MASTEQDNLTDMKARRDKYRKTQEDNRSVQQGLSDTSKAQADALDDEIAKSESGFNSRLVSAQKTINDAIEVCAKLLAGLRSLRGTLQWPRVTVERHTRVGTH